MTIRYWKKAARKTTRLTRSTLTSNKPCEARYASQTSTGALTAPPSTHKTLSLSSSNTLLLLFIIHPHALANPQSQRQNPTFKTPHALLIPPHYSPIHPPHLLPHAHNLHNLLSPRPHNLVFFKKGGCHGVTPLAPLLPAESLRFTSCRPSRPSYLPTIIYSYLSLRYRRPSSSCPSQSTPLRKFVRSCARLASWQRARRVKAGRKAAIRAIRRSCTRSSHYYTTSLVLPRSSKRLIVQCRRIYKTCVTGQRLWESYAYAAKCRRVRASVERWPYCGRVRR